MTAQSSLLLPLAGFLAEASGSIRRFDLETAIPLDDELVLAGPIRAGFEISRTNRGIFIEGDVSTVLEMDCSRCLVPVSVILATRIREEILPSIDQATGQAVDRTAEPDVARLTAHHELDIEILLREAIALSAPIAPLCGPDCVGLCIECGERLSGDHRDHATDDIDPRLAALRRFQVDAGGENE